MEIQPTIDAAAADHLVLEQWEEEGEEEEMRALELICEEEKKNPNSTKKRFKTWQTLFLFLGPALLGFHTVWKVGPSSTGASNSIGEASNLHASH